MRLSELINQLLQKRDTLLEDPDVDYFGELRDKDPPVYISIGLKCIPISVEAKDVSLVYGYNDGVDIGTDIDLPQELKQEWFELQQKVMRHIRGKR